MPSLTELERGALVLSAGDRNRRETAALLGVGERAVNNALQRARKNSPSPPSASAPGRSQTSDGCVRRVVRQAIRSALGATVAPDAG